MSIEQLSVEQILCAIFTLLQVIDVWTTHKIMSSGGRELNPVMDWFFKKFGVLPSIIVAKVAVLIIAWLYLISNIEIVFVICVFYIFIVINNLKQMNRL
jgi:hypothetical protein